MVKNGDLIDVKPDGSITVAGKPVGGGGSEYTAGSNIEISESKEISLKNNISGIESVKFGSDIGPTLGHYGGSGLGLNCNSNSYDYLPIYMVRRGTDESKNENICLIFYSDNHTHYNIYFDRRGLSGDAYAFLTKGGRVPFVPSNDGTYVLKATVSGGAVTYNWVAE